jgi:hypothetical protein
MSIDVIGIRRRAPERPGENRVRTRDPYGLQTTRRAVSPPEQGVAVAGMYRSGADGVPEFIEGAAPTEERLHALLQTVIARLMTLLTHRGVLLEDDGQPYLAESDTAGEEARTLRPLQAGR